MGATWRRAAHLGWLVFALCGAAAVVRASTARLPPPPQRLSPTLREQVGHAAANQEAEWRRKARQSFPGDHWSQDDDFGAAERKWAVDEAHRRGVPVTEVLEAIDAELHSRPVQPPRKATASPCKPRPFYD
ncbi:hypothetical protein [Comamonas sp. JC664]|uniref:hypothetical protein n=1 Tax=Comamonas sp. JC664 TaxID=2801917 RepID=UPI00174D5AD0|nr:hypothetical protein [Comamonas sp. JC664]MBL0695215.1 hypothetical protein [Comamonas sp. JC664]GHG86781.1 hypothetical protein GCM10012319_44060 [Comamonas sp. KCTC 72670]